ncbi:uncharacterized protein K452DRAFT_325537 [Aplosporella prunicola CBS 121167]|uniref:proline--tRNA ligase n=1 Tax=Aplosporella prunicola CBS 121167 TaxID=1176127 RepID=A0A6A6BLZ2_9PEZI|nr:uncharacterized protein K452DRAFT_325537 [Aplosporella prunicola CBS 121167]KAF2143561.1 hypothetical protein K452DRAFT_325537 [Aplosporella prunicola CBS 121167]
MPERKKDTKRKEPKDKQQKQKPMQKKKVEGAALIGIDVAKEDDLGEWYQQVLTKGGMLAYYDVAGCYILKPWSYAIWEHIQGWFNERIKKMGVKNCYFPIFISADNLQREKDHVEGFAAEVAWVTKGGKSDLEKPVAVRPTSETAMYPYFANEIRSHRDLPLKLNQWSNIVRWEFKHPMPFIRSREFLWQEGHTAHLTLDEASTEVLQILDHYAGIYEELLAVPVVKGLKTENEKFPGAEYTTTIEGYIPATGRGIQAGTSHCLGQHFSKMFDIKVEDPSPVKEGEQKKPPIHVWQNSWGLTTRSIGVMVLTHSDNKGLVIPPRVADIQVVIVPVGVTAKTSDEDKEKLYKEIDDIASTLRNASVRVETDMREGYSPGWKFNDWELKGVPLRIEFGPKDSAAQAVTAARRDKEGKSQIAIAEIGSAVPTLLETIQADLFAKAKADFDAARKQVTAWDEFVPALDAKNVCLIPHCLGDKCEDEIKELSARKNQETTEEAHDARAPSMGAKSLCIPYEQPAQDLSGGETQCLNPNCGQKAKKWVLFGRSY